MKKLFREGDRKETRYTVAAEDLATFKGQNVHPVCSTFALAREIEWATRQFVLEMKENNEEGIGTHLSIDHKAPAFEGNVLVIHSWVESLEGTNLVCGYRVTSGERLIATGKTGQKILDKGNIDEIFSNLKDG